MPSAEDLEGMYCEDYSDQEGQDFKYLAFVTFSGDFMVEPVSENLTGQAHEIYRRYGKSTDIKVYR